MSSKAVNRPTDTKQKEKDINQKLQLFGIFHAFKNSKLPSNKQCDVALNSALNSKVLASPPSELSDEGKVLVADVRNVIEHAKKMLLTKNQGELLQDFIWQAQQITAGDAKAPNVPVTKEDSKQDANRALDGLKTLGTLLLTNGEFRKILSDATVLMKDIAADASQKAANQVRPSEEQLAQIDAPAEENVWHEKPNINKDDLKSKFKKRSDNASTGSPSVADYETTGTADRAITGTADREITGTADNESVTPSEMSRRKKYANQTKEYLQDKIPKERREQTIWRLKKMVIEVQGHADYQQAIETLLDLAEKYAGHTKDVTSQSGSAAKDVRSTDSVKIVENNLRTLIERFANNTSLSNFFESLNNIYRDADQDPELRGWFSSMDTFIRRALREQGFIMEEECNRQWNDLYEKGRYLARERYRNHTDNIVDQIKFLADQFERDPQNKAFADSIQKLFLDLGRDSNGKVVFKKHLLTDIRDIILPGIFENVRYVPIPRIEVSDPMVDVVVENLVIESDNLMPNVVEFGSDNYFRWGRKKISNKRDNKIMIAGSGIQADLRDVSYYIKKKQGFPSITDTGIMDIFLGGEGFSFKIAASTADKNDKQQHFVKLDKVSVNIKNMDIKLRKSKHKALFATFKPLLFRVVRPALEKVIEGQIRNAFQKGDAYAHEIHTEATKAQEAAREDPENAPTILSRYADAMRARAQAKAKQAEAIMQRDTKVQTVTTMHDSIFPDIKLPGGVSTKATEYVDLARKGERWESPIFSIGHANESTDIPTPGPVTRKAPTADGTVGQSGVAGTIGHTNGHTNGTHTTLPTNGTHTNGFSREVDQAFVNDKTKNLSDGVTNGAHAVTTGPAVVTSGPTVA
ncbi:hypothetical protein N7448_004854 [Penicillium atrosanguineum]|uniref:Uncharacterized protein n=1 Tax=Penicillium atrosanguineum TaxID=1132637 RepID=A0A9W9H2F7_9EURO|nr:uncharacterized protein N7443_008604 [Penicillium atrosanguineum]KAJ5125534.1 hypothetical protein N7526_007711 [Penicillium atrosanguineum]KAJ5136300.1 hypothetical protein N7448_004854 [Penicillium atrosanguineum]KAJ5292651.1 hypothetical protein N7443_008604 [Penicillium atrosanguineum]KAJ5303325.1 hypothetical protein N7476_010124 [Penicillium atrosanguineum]